MSLSLRNLGSKVRKLHLENNMLILVKKGTAFTEENNMEKFIEVLNQTSLENIVVVVVDDLYDIESLNERTMNKHGWYRAETLFKAIKRKDVKNRSV